MLDRNGLRPALYLITKNDMMVVASEVGVRDFEPGDIKEKGRLQPGKILLVDTEKGEIYYDGELKKHLAEAKPYRCLLYTSFQQTTNNICLYTAIYQDNLLKLRIES